MERTGTLSKDDFRVNDPRTLCVVKGNGMSRRQVDSFIRTPMNIEIIIPLQYFLYTYLSIP